MRGIFSLFSFLVFSFFPCVDDEKKKTVSRSAKKKRFQKWKFVSLELQEERAREGRAAGTAFCPSR